ncbi:MAG: sigma-70 family RNA polymerase sigma factor [Planctomycetales bacterium]|nr:sigma-70 family RNA polymerase sigma factor [Planctomycetales bacterium]
MSDDRDLIARLRRGDEDAFRDLVGSLHGRLLRFARALGLTAALAEEVVQETWLAVLRGLERFEGRSALTTWIFAICANGARTRAAREGREIPLGDLSRDPEEPAVDPSRFRPSGAWAQPPPRGDARPPDEILLSREAASRVREALDALPPAQRAVVVLRDLEGLPGPEVCNVLGLTESNMRVLLHRGRSRLRGVLEDYVRGGGETHPGGRT